MKSEQVQEKELVNEVIKWKEQLKLTESNTNKTKAKDDEGSEAFQSPSGIWFLWLLPCK